MPQVIGMTTDGKEMLRHDPSEGCAYRCICGTWLRSRLEVRAHWAISSRGHSIFLRVRTGQVFHQTLEGLHERDWDVEELSGLSSSALVHPRSLLITDDAAETCEAPAEGDRSC